MNVLETVLRPGYCGRHIEKLLRLNDRSPFRGLPKLFPRPGNARQTGLYQSSPACPGAGFMAWDMLETVMEEICNPLTNVVHACKAMLAA